jgi:hypothetical protein
MWYDMEGEIGKNYGVVCMDVLVFFFSAKCSILVSMLLSFYECLTCRVLDFFDWYVVR